MMHKIFSIACALVLCAMPLSEGQQGLNSREETAPSRNIERVDVHTADSFYEDTGLSEEEWEQGWRQALALHAAEVEETFADEFDDIDFDDADWDLEAI